MLYKILETIIIKERSYNRTLAQTQTLSFGERSFSHFICRRRPRPVQSIVDSYAILNG